MNKFKKIIEGVKNGWHNMDSKKKILMISVVVMVFVVVALFTYFNRVVYAPLFTNLELDDSGRIVEDLKAKKIDYKLNNGGKDILIDEKLIDGYRLEVATEGNMPEKSSGFEMFDQMGMMATDEDRKIMYQRALSGELQRSIMSLDAILAAKVHLVLPEKSIFETEEKPGSASVIVELDPTKKINDETVRGIAALVYGAVDNVPEENIQIIDSKGNLLSSFLKAEKQEGAVGSLDSYDGMREEFQQKIKTNLDELLSGVFGRDKVKISVFADLDFDAEETTVISYKDPITRSEQTTSMVEGGTGGNIGDGNNNVVGDEGEDGILIDKTTNNELTTETKTTIKAPGKVRKLTTSVVYDGNLSPEAQDQILSIVAAATGYDTTRGDFISIEGVNFDKSYEENMQKELDALKEAEDKEKSALAKYRNYLVYGLVGIFLLLLIVGIVRRLRSRNREEDDLFKEKFPMEVPIGEISKTIEKEEPQTQKIEKIEVKKDVNQLKANDFAVENPDVAADLIKAWMKD
ncbi:flagellar basal-body MS-ring/collar protein FliF [Tissierella creatinophila]|uniref:Flagellar M-ring protein n=1 Tax=Tissierella creatinophila DSM 6911 TaxID=1123403 RepID=A0A1U7M914_TISCR|nr:flagellar basal-body MS-ring/collar protein FliF [Tissierella creatinophila]OLS03775.1 flagellar M-ring protein [Tissierella creatinophila DSM 6911]